MTFFLDFETSFVPKTCFVTTGHIIDARKATPGWENTHYNSTIYGGFIPAHSVDGPPGKLQPHPMQRSRVLEEVRPISAVPVVANGSTSVTYLFTLPYEIAGFCTLLLPRDAPVGLRVRFRHGEAIDTATGRVVDSPCVLNPPHGSGCEHSSYVARGDALGMGTHEKMWRRLAISGSADGADDDAREAFTPAFQYTGFKFIEVSSSLGEVAYAGPDLGMSSPNISSLVCHRIGVGFDWIGDVAVSATVSQSRPFGGTINHSTQATTAAQRFNRVVAATRATAIANYVFDLPTDCPTREKRGWTGDAAATHRTLASFFDMRAAWTKWTDDMIYTQSLLQPAGTVPEMVMMVSRA